VKHSEDLLIAEKPTCEELKQKVKELQKEANKGKRAEKALGSMHRKLQAAFDAIQADMCVVDLDFNLTDVNEFLIKAFGLPDKKSVLGRKCFEVLKGREDICPNCAVAKVYQTKAAAYRTTTHEDEISTGGRSFEIFAYPIVDQDGNLSGAVEFGRDVTKRKQAEEALKKAYAELDQKVRKRTAELAKANEQLKREIQERKQAEALIIEKSRDLECILENAPIGLSYLDSEMRFIRTNRFVERKFGLKSEEIRSQHCYDVLGQYANDGTRKGKDRICDTCQVVKTLEDGKIHTHERAIRPDYIVRNTSAPIKDQNGSITGAIELIEDITTLKRAGEEKKALEAKLQQAQKMEAIGTLAGGIAHDFNNLLMGIQGHASLLMLHIGSDHLHFERLKGIQDMVQAGASLTEQLLGFARGGKYEVKPTDLNELIKQSCEMFGRTQKDIEINRKHQKGIWPVEVDRGQIQQVLLNLYVNAWQAMSGGGYIYIETSNVMLDENDTKPFNVNPGKYVKISVTDTGAGMDKTTQQKIFDPFFTTKAMGRGTGLGLASTYGIIKNHSGIINVYSEKGKGSTFNIYLPASEKEVSITKESGTDEIQKGTETVLLVDDEEIILDVGKDMLTEIGYKVLIAKSGKEAVEVYRKHKDTIDLVIVDLIMSGMGGGEAYDRMKEIDPDLKALLSSGYSIAGEASKILERGCNDFIQKPFNMEELSVKIREILDKK